MQGDDFFFDEMRRGVIPGLVERFHPTGVSLSQSALQTRINNLIYISIKVNEHINQPTLVCYYSPQTVYNQARVVVLRRDAGTGKIVFCPPPQPLMG